MARSVIRAMQILESLGPGEAGLTHTQLSQKLGIPKSSISDLLSDLQKTGFVNFNTETKKYQLTPKILTIAHKYLDGVDLVKVGTPVVKSLSEATGESVAIYVKSGYEGHLIHKQDSSQPVSRLLKVGARAPLYAIAAGKILLASLSEIELEEYFSTISMRPLTKHTITDPQRLKEELAAIRKGELACNDEEFEEGVLAIAAPVHDGENNLVAALCVVAPRYRINAETRKNLEKLLIEKSVELSKRL